MMIPAHALAGILSIHLGFILSKGSKHWILYGFMLAFLSHAIIDTLAIFTYHDSSPSGSSFSQFVFWFWLIGAIAVIGYGIQTDRRYGIGIVFALSYDIWDHWILRTISCAPQGFPDGCMSLYAYEGLHLHHLEWFLLDTFFANTERHYGDERYFIVELAFVAIMLFCIRRLRLERPLPIGGEDN